MRNTSKMKMKGSSYSSYHGRVHNVRVAKFMEPMFGGKVPLNSVSKGHAVYKSHSSKMEVTTES